MCYKNRRKSFFYDFFLRSMTWEYRKLKGVTGGYRGLQEGCKRLRRLQGVTGSYRGLQEVTWGEKALQGVTKDYKIFILTRTFQHTFSWSILHKNQS